MQLGQVLHEPIAVVVLVVAGCAGAGDKHGQLVLDHDLRPQSPVVLAEQARGRLHVFCGQLPGCGQTTAPPPG